MSEAIFNRMLDDDVIDAAARNMFDNRTIELDQDGDDDWDELPEDWREEWRDGARAAIEAAVARVAFQSQGSETNR